VNLPYPPFLLITDRNQARLPLPKIAEAAFSAGCRWISIRENDLPRRELQNLVTDIAAAGKEFGAFISLHGQLGLAAEMKTGIHLQFRQYHHMHRDLSDRDQLIGVSIHSTTEARKLNPNRADYAITGAVFQTQSKPGYDPIGIVRLHSIVEQSSVPIIAIGGITEQTCASVIQTGARGIAVMGAIMRAKDPKYETELLIGALLDATKKTRHPTILTR
jgi:thiamine-phosphate pyrophosphorylase